MVQTQSAHVVIPSQEALLEGVLTIPRGARGIVVFAHGSGSSRFSSRNRKVADLMGTSGLAVLLFDLLTAKEHARDSLTSEYRFDIPLLAGRLADTIDWLGRETITQALDIGLFGASTGAAAALIAAAARPDRVHAVVSRGGRPDLADEALGAVRAPTLLIVGERDAQVLELNHQAAKRLGAIHRLAIVPGATHLFEEPGALERVAELAAQWFLLYLGRRGGSSDTDGQ